MLMVYPSLPLITHDGKSQVKMEVYSTGWPVSRRWMFFVALLSNQLQTSILFVSCWLGLTDSITPSCLFSFFNAGLRHSSISPHKHRLNPRNQSWLGTKSAIRDSLAAVSALGFVRHNMCYRGPPAALKWSAARRRSRLERRRYRGEHYPSRADKE